MKQEFQKKVGNGNSTFTDKDKVQIKCKICFSEFVSVSEMDVHFELCKKTLVCDICNTNFESVESIEEHMDICNSRSKYKCSVCEKCFDDDVSCVNHEQKCTGKFTCKNCHKKFGHWKLLLEHFQKEHQNLFCNVCKKLFHIKSELIEHKCM